MAVNAATLETVDSRTIREDLMDAENILDVWETPFISMIAKHGKCSNVKHEWPRLALITGAANQQIEGDDAPAYTAANTADRRWNYTQISTKLISVSDTSQWVDGAANIEKISKQISYKLKELKMDKEFMLVGTNQVAVPGSSGVARKAASLAAFMITNANRGASVNPIAPTISGSPTAADGYPNGVAGSTTPGTGRAISESLFRTVMASVWNSGGQPKYALTTPALKAKISETFTGYNTAHMRYIEDGEKKVTLATDVYQSDFGEVQIVPDRYSLTGNVFFIDPNYVSVDYGQETAQKEVARTGLSEKRLISCEYTLTVGNEAANGVLADVT